MPCPTDETPRECCHRARPLPQTLLHPTAGWGVLIPRLGIRTRGGCPGGGAHVWQEPRVWGSPCSACASTLWALEGDTGGMP